MNAVQNFWNGLDWSVPGNILLSILPAMICITLHELAHGFVAFRLGDPTAKDAGRLTLNPLRHIDIFGLLMMIVFQFGWAKPVPVDMRRFRSPRRGMALCALAGPLCNLLITCVLLFVYGLVFYPLNQAGTGVADIVVETLFKTSYLSLALAVFNIIPISPLDGSKVLFSFLNERQYYLLMRYERYGMILLLLLVVSDVIPLSEITWFLYERLFVIAEFSFEIMTKFLG